MPSFPGAASVISALGLEVLLEGKISTVENGIGRGGKVDTDAPGLLISNKHTIARISIK